MEKFKVNFEQTVRAEVEVEANSYEEAVAKAMESKPVVVASRMHANWVSTIDHLDKTEEYEYEVIGPCAHCEVPIVNRSIPGQPYTYGSDPLNEHGGLICYKCIQKIEKEEGRSFSD